MKTVGLSVAVALFALPVCVAADDRAKYAEREVIREDSFTMLNIVPCSPGDEETAAADAAEFADRTGNPYCLYSMTLYPQGKPAMKTVDAAVASYRRWAELLKDSKVKPAILLQAIVGHWTQDLAEKECESWQRAVNVKGVVTRYCPLDPGYRGYIRETARRLAACGPAVILSDDDVRAFSPLAECTCPLHVEEYNRRTGRNLTAEDMRSLIAKADWQSPEHIAFTELQRDTVAGVCALIREGIDSVDPGIPSGVCEPGWAWARRYIADNAFAMAGPSHTAWARLANGRYSESAPKSEVGGITMRTMASIERMRSSGVLPLDESDTWPHNLWSKSSAAFHAKLATSAFLGMKGAKIWCVNSHKGRYPVSRHYTDVLAAHRGFYPAVSAAIRDSRPEGVIIPCVSRYPGFNVAGEGPSEPFESVGWAQVIFSWYGIPYTVTANLDRDGIYALGGPNAVRRFSDEEIRKILSHRVIIEGQAARALVKRGFSDLIGVELLKDTPLYTDEYSEGSGDFMSLPRSSRPPVLKAMPGARTLSSLVWRESRYVKSFERVAPAATVYRNRLGGTVAVMSYNFGLGVSYLYSEARQRFVYDVLDAVNGGMFDNICVNAQNVMTLARRADDGADLILVQNLNYDTDSAVMLRRRSRPSSVEMMGADGHWRECDFSWNDGTVVLPVEWPCYGVKMLRIR
jgi:hypothetical protein